MAVDATGTPTSPDSIPTYATSADAPSGKGFNAAMAAIQTALVLRPSKPVGLLSGEVPVWNGSAWVRSSVTPLNSTNISGYTDYTPTWISSGTQPSVGNGVMRGRYVQLGKFVHTFGSLLMGSTTTFGTGVYSFSLPVNRSAVGNASGRLNGVFNAEVTGGTSSILGVVDTAASVSAFRPIFAATYMGVDTQVGQTVPYTWANGDQMWWNMMYEGV